MKPCFAIVILMICFQSCSDQTKNSSVANTPPDTLAVKETKVTSPDTTVSPPKAPADPTDPRLKTGDHMFTLHWISWDHPGKVDIQPDSNGWHSISGGQKSRVNKDYIKINGLIRILNDSDLLFQGDIESKVETVSNGKVCRKEGEQIFRTRTGRKYWRLQNMNSCEGGTVDYIDIYFN